MDKNETRKLIDEADELLGPEEKFKDLVTLLESIVSKIKSNEDVKADINLLRQLIVETQLEGKQAIIKIVESISRQHDSIETLAKIVDNNKISKVVDGQEKLASTAQKELVKITKEFSEGLSKIRKEQDKATGQILKIIQKLTIPPDEEPNTVAFDWNRGRLDTVVEAFDGFKIRHTFNRDAASGRIVRIDSKKT